MKIGIAGGIGSGKSYVASRLARRGIEVYDCDAAAKRLMATSDRLRRELTALIGPNCYVGDRLNKGAVSRFLLASETNKLAINAIVHPAVFDDFIASGMEWMESAIMFESGADRYVDRVIAVTAPQEVRIERIVARDGITPAQAVEWIARQMPQEETRRRAHFEIVNDGHTDIDNQLNIILRQLCNTPF